MIRLIAAAFGGLMLLLACVPAEAKDILLVRGIFGNIVAPMTDLATDLRRQGHKVTMAEWHAIPDKRFDIAITHSRGELALRANVKKVLTIDPTFLNGGCPAGKICVNWHAPIDAFPFLICCGGYAVAGARNTKVPGTLSFIVFAPGHVSMPTRIKAQIIAEVAR